MNYTQENVLDIGDRVYRRAYVEGCVDACDLIVKAITEHPETPILTVIAAMKATMVAEIGVKPSEKVPL